MTDKEFWDWFLTKKTEIEKFMTSETGDYSVYNELTDKLRSYNQLVMPELTQDTENTNVLILTCDGKRDGIGPVQRLFDSAPAIDKWKIQKFRAPGHVNELNFDGLSLRVDEIKVKYQSEGDHYNIELFIKGYRDSDDRYKALAFLYLDHFVGEYNVMTKIGRIDFKKLGMLTKSEGKIGLRDLRAVVERLN